MFIRILERLDQPQRLVDGTTDLMTQKYALKCFQIYQNNNSDIKIIIIVTLACKLKARPSDIHTYIVANDEQCKQTLCEGKA